MKALWSGDPNKVSAERRENHTKPLLVLKCLKWLAYLILQANGWSHTKHCSGQSNPPPNPEEWGHLSWRLNGNTISQPIFSQEDESCAFLGVWAFLTGAPSRVLQESTASQSWEGEGTVEATSGPVHGPRKALTDSRRLQVRVRKEITHVERSRCQAC